MYSWYRHGLMVLTWTLRFYLDSWYRIGTPESHTYARAKCYPFIFFLNNQPQLKYHRLKKDQGKSPQILTKSQKTQKSRNCKKSYGYRACHLNQQRFAVYYVTKSPVIPSLFIGCLVQIILSCRFHYYGSFGAGAVCNCIGFFFVLFAFKETRKIGNTSEKKTSMASLENLLCSFKCLLRSRREGMRHVIILMVTCMVVS